MRRFEQKAWALAALAIAGCGPGAGDHPVRRLASGQAETLPSAPILRSDDIGPPLPAEARLIGDAGEGGFHPSVAAGAPTPAWGTWTAKGDAGVGEIRLRATLPEGVRRFGLPIVTGPALGAVELRVRVEGAEQDLARLRYPEGFLTWRAWLVRAPTGPGPHRLEVIVTDRGEGWGQWIAVGGPVLAAEDQAG